MSDVLIRNYYAYFNNRRFNDAAELFSTDAVFEHPPFEGTRRGGSGYIQFAQMWVGAFPDGTLTIEHVEQRGDTICEVDLTATGTHSGDFDMGPFGVFKPTGVRATIRFRELLEIRIGQITYSSLTFDVHELIRQLTK